MKLCVLSNHDRILEAQKRLEKLFQGKTTERIRCRVSHPGTGSPGTASSEPAHVSWSEHSKLWFDPRKHHDNYYWNAFGTEKPQTGESMSPDCEINPPVEGINRKLGGVFAEDESGYIYILQRGNKFRGIRKKDFRREYKYREKWKTACDGGQQNEFVLIGGLEQPDLFDKIFEFVEEVKRIRSVMKSNP